eukprot:5138160-Pleurochrysis_carterae.AAC.1
MAGKGAGSVCPTVPTAGSDLNMYRTQLVILGDLGQILPNPEGGDRNRNKAMKMRGVKGDWSDRTSAGTSGVTGSDKDLEERASLPRRR